MGIVSVVNHWHGPYGSGCNGRVCGIVWQWYEGGCLDCVEQRRIGEAKGVGKVGMAGLSRKESVVTGTGVHVVGIERLRSKDDGEIVPRF
ncbi:hypothetical protein VNO78_31320 [Psophocarpus tetragonolobus]|uniref:Uncharacterized protein n=1 Tax=Psophocarpus tetragonolobus TaxID=3891 RepID=A0AAN9RY60_PSOTE